VFITAGICITTEDLKHDTTRALFKRKGVELIPSPKKCQQSQAVKKFTLEKYPAEKLIQVVRVTVFK
jgi:hypothetical protein